MTERSVKAVAVRAAVKSGNLIRRSVGKVEKISYKGRDNIVTDVDKKAEAVILREVLTAFPRHSILSEERAPRIGSSAYKWIIDPLDGTTNFAHAFPFFCVSIAVEERGHTIFGVVYDPMRDELFTAERGKGARLNGRRILVTKTKRLVDSFLATGFSYGFRRKDRNVRHFRKFLISTQAIRRAGSAALDLCYVACGRFDGFWELDLHPWDSAAGQIIVEEAGGIVTRFDGSPYTPYNKDILATNGLIHGQMKRSLTGR